jgi:hypothetical protein
LLTRDEAEALLRVEKSYGSCCYAFLFFCEQVLMTASSRQSSGQRQAGSHMDRNPAFTDAYVPDGDLGQT